MGAPSVESPSVNAPAVASEHLWLVGLVLAAVLIRLATLGAYPLMDNTEARYAEVARKMGETADWVTPHHRYGVEFWSKPPLSIWMTASSYLLFGVNAFAARLASLLPCLAVAWIVFDLAADRGSRDVALRASRSPRADCAVRPVSASSAVHFTDRGLAMSAAHAPQGPDSG